MTPKKIVMVLVMAFCSLTIMPAFASDVMPANPIEKTNNDARVQQLVNRLKEIRDMDKSHLTSSEKKSLRKEVREMKKEVRANSNGIYLSVGAIIIIVLLLLLLL